MKYCFLLIMSALLTTMVSCKKQPGRIITTNDNHTPDTATPACILHKITALQNAAVHNPPAEVYSYSYLNQKVYYITSDCCDQFNFLYDADCNVICAPDGGIAGHGNGGCADFLQVRTDERLIWNDPR